MSRLRKNIYITMLVAQGVIIGLIENMTPYLLVFAPGAKLGLVNLTTIITTLTTRKRDSFSLVYLRLILTTLLGGILSTFFYSANNALLSYFNTLLIKQLGPRRISIIGISTAGGFLRNAGRLLTTSFFAHSWAPMLCLPFLSLSGLLSGIAIGITANYLLQYVQTLQKFQLSYEQITKHKWSRFS